MEITLILPGSESGAEVRLKNSFIASRNPLFIGFIVNPGEPAWQVFQASKNVLLAISGNKYSFGVEYRIDIGENTLFFARPEEGSSISLAD